jgi:transposase
LRLLLPHRAGTAPHRPIERGLAGPGLLAHVLVSKYADHLPLYRQSEIYAREGVELDRSTLADWAGGASRTLRPLVDAYMTTVLRRIADHPINRIGELLPWNLFPATPAEVEAA